MTGDCASHRTISNSVPAIAVKRTVAVAVDIDVDTELMITYVKRQRRIRFGNPPSREVTQNHSGSVIFSRATPFQKWAFWLSAEFISLFALFYNHIAQRLEQKTFKIIN